MLKHFKHLYTDAIRTEAMRRFGLTPISLDILPDASHSYVYECKRDGKSYILKITHTIHRRPNTFSASWSSSTSWPTAA